MEFFSGPIIVGIIICVLGIINMKGNISTLNWFHRQNVSEEDLLPFGRLMGLGKLMIGITIIASAVFSFWVGGQDAGWLYTAGSILRTIGVISGIGLNFYALIKYNGSIF